VTNAAGTVISIRTADCVPVLLADPVRKVVAAVHAGWKGTSKAIVRRAVERMQAHYGTHPADVIAAIGPAIGECCYEVSADVAAEFVAYGVAIAEEGKPHLNLAAINRMQLEQAGVVAVDVLDACTKCEAELLHSFRRDGDRSGRMHAAIGILG
jgi:YfiH family protein